MYLNTNIISRIFAHLLIHLCQTLFHNWTNIFYIIILFCGCTWTQTLYLGFLPNHALYLTKNIFCTWTQTSFPRILPKFVLYNWTKIFFTHQTPRGLKWTNILSKKFPLKSCILKQEQFIWKSVAGTVYVEI